MFTNMEFYRIISALEDVEYKAKESVIFYERCIQDYTTEGNQEACERSVRGLHRSEKRLEEMRHLKFKTQAAQRWNEAEKILFPERHTV